MTRYNSSIHVEQDAFRRPRQLHVNDKVQQQHACDTSCIQIHVLMPNLT